ncbi:MAG: 5'-nucleotidase C-terminal domain-containing protein [Armatimonadota bacterium]|nr:MAG: 5'-nucleotidase C-terminal domain-containing protein [Armatimonadota bacterium]
MTEMIRKALVSFAACVALIGAQGGAWSQETARLTVPLDGTKNAVAETNLGNLVADAVRAATTADFAFIQASALQPVTVPPGDVTVEALRAMLVFPDEPISVVRLDAARIQDALERSLALLPHPNKGFLHVSRLRLSFDQTASPGARLRGLVAVQTNAALAQDKTYRVAMPRSLARGALGYFRVFNSAPSEHTEVTLAQALTAFAVATKPLAPRIEGRIKPVQLEQ